MHSFQVKPTSRPKTPSMGPQTQDLYVARGGGPTSIPSDVHRESHRDPPWGKSSGGRVSGPGRVQHPPAKESVSGGENDEIPYEKDEIPYEKVTKSLTKK